MKIGFKTKMRGVYVARKEVFNPDRGVHALIGAINQYNVPSSNSVVPKAGVKASYFRKEKRIAEKKSRMMKAYLKRKMRVGANSFVFNIEELATMWHFPMSHVKTPLLQKAVAKAVEPPSQLPVESMGPALGIPIPGMSETADVPVIPDEEKYNADSAGDYGSKQQFG